MNLSPHTTLMISRLHEFSGRKLTRPEDLAVLLEMAAAGELSQTLEELSFSAKFVAQSHRIMNRIGREGDGYEQLVREFTDRLETVRTLLGQILAAGPADEQRRLENIYLPMTPGGLDALLALCYDLSWYKNWLIDHPDR